jgi:cytochrome c peroxidase
VGKFKTPSLRNLPMTAPYMHDGSMKTLQDVLEHYNKGGRPHENADLLMRPLGLSKQDVNDLIMFLNALSDPKFTTNPQFGPPQKPY